jgi:transcriptional regulator with XRE-family HTH domain
MTFQKKLERLAPTVNKSRASAAVGLKPNTISTYLAKGSIPRADIALKIAKALSVPIEWLIDDASDWPPPEAVQLSLSSLSDADLLREMARRVRNLLIDFFDETSRVMKVDWSEAAREAERTGEKDALPHAAAMGRRVLISAQNKFNRILQDFDVECFSILHHDELPGSETDFEKLTTSAAIDAWLSLQSLPDLIRFAGVIRSRPDWAGSVDNRIADFRDRQGQLHAHLVSNQRPATNDEVQNILKKSRPKSPPK